MPVRLCSVLVPLRPEDDIQGTRLSTRYKLEARVYVLRMLYRLQHCTLYGVQGLACTTCVLIIKNGHEPKRKQKGMCRDHGVHPKVAVGMVSVPGRTV